MKNENVKILKITLSIPCHAINHVACSKLRYSGESAVWENEWEKREEAGKRLQHTPFCPDPTRLIFAFSL